MSKPLVSVVIPVKNGARYIRQAIESVLAQDYRPIEIIVVDAHSTDDTAAIAQSFSQVKFLNQERPGLSEAWNLGISTATGQYIAFLSHDDLWLAGKLTTQMNALLADQRAMYCVTHAKFFLEEGHSIPRSFKPELLEGDHVGYIMETLVARKKLFAEIGTFDPRLCPGEDTDWYARAKDAGVPHAVISEVLVRKRVHDTNTSLDAAVDGNHKLLISIKRSLDRKHARKAVPTEAGKLG